MYLVEKRTEAAAGESCAVNYYKIAKNYRRHLQQCESMVPGLQPAGTGWIMLVELYIALHERQRISVSGVSVMAGVPSTTGLRYLDALAANGIVVRVPDNNDRRRSWVRLTDAGETTVEQMLAGMVTAIGAAANG